MILDQCISVISLNELFEPWRFSYSLWIKEPMDFSTIKKLKDGKYTNFDAFERDMVLVGTIVYTLIMILINRAVTGYCCNIFRKIHKVEETISKRFSRDTAKITFLSRRALDLILLRERNGVYKLNNKLSRPWKFHVVKVKTEESSSSSSSNENKSVK